MLLIFIKKSRFLSTLAPCALFCRQYYYYCHIRYRLSCLSVARFVHSNKIKLVLTDSKTAMLFDYFSCTVCIYWMKCSFCGFSAVSTVDIIWLLQSYLTKIKLHFIVCWHENNMQNKLRIHQLVTFIVKTCENFVMFADREGRGHIATCYWLQKGSVFPWQKDDNVCW